MTEQEVYGEQASQSYEGDEAAFSFPTFPRRIPWWPYFSPVSGLYEWSQFSLPIRQPFPVKRLSDEMGEEFDVEAFHPWWFSREELRLDVDRYYPQMTASGTVFGAFSTRVHWIADLTSTAYSTWTGNIWFKDGNASSFPYTNVQIQVKRGWFSTVNTANVTFSGGGPNRVRTFRYKSPYFHPVEFEFDSVQGTAPVISVQTHAHPNRPANLANENLTMQTVYRRAGFDVKTGGGSVPLSGAGSNARWSDAEMHDAMQTFWSKFANKAQWSMWVLFASLHDRGNSLGGIMFDDIGPNHRQGTAIFNDAFISTAPTGEPAVSRDAWVQRMLFWTAAHEMGHGFNLAHSWQKQHPASWGTSWIPLSNEPEERSFMNYPFRVSGGQSAFFSDFEYRFSDAELLFMRHAPAKFVQMGNSDWFDDHAFQQANISPEPTFELDLRVNRAKYVFEFLEPVVLELKLKNISSQPQLIQENILSSQDQMTVIIKKKGSPARQFTPYARELWQPANRVLRSGESDYESLFVSAGQNGWDLADPGTYTVQMALHLDDQDIVSTPINIQIAPPRERYEEELLAQDYFSDDVGRILTFDGSRALSKGNDTLRDVVAQLADRKVSRHARIALGNPLARTFKQLDLSEGAVDLTSAQAAGAEIKIGAPDEKEAREELTAALSDNPYEAAESLGHIDYKYYVDRFSDWLKEQGDSEGFDRVRNEMRGTLSGRGVKKEVLED